MDEDIVFLKKIVSIYSPSTEETKVSEFIVSEMRKLGFDAKIDEVGNAVGKIGDGEKVILIAGHIDTVPGKIDVRVEGDDLYGRGSVDAKGPFASFVRAVSKADLSGKTVIVAGCVEEEIATSKGARNLIGKYNPDFIIIGEPSSSEAVTLGYKGRLLIDYVLKREIAHTASQDLGVIENAIDFYVRVRQRCQEFNKDKERIFSQVQISTRNINSESDGLCDTVKMKIGLRIPIGFDIKEFKSFCNDNISGATIRFYGEERPIKSEKNNALVRSFLKSIRKQGKRPKFKVKTGTSDMNVLGAAYPNTPIVTYGPGDSAQDHTPNEHIELKDYSDAIAVLVDVLETL